MTQTPAPLRFVLCCVATGFIACGDDSATMDAAIATDGGVDSFLPDSATVDAPGEDAGGSDVGDDAGQVDAGPEPDAPMGMDASTDAGPAPDPEQLFPVRGDNLLPEPSLETQDTWSLGPRGHSFTNARANTGTTSLQLVSDGGGTVTTFSDYVDLVPGQEYILSASVAAENLIAGPNGGGDTPILLINQRRDGAMVPNGSGRHTDGYRWMPYDSDTYGFTNAGMDMRFQLVAAANEARIGARTWSNNTAGRTWWDDFELVALSFPHRGDELEVLQAEESALVGGEIDTHDLDFTGTGYVDVSGDPGATMTWPLGVSGDVVVSIRYSREGRRTPMTVMLNGEEVVRNIAPEATGRRGMYATVDVGLRVAAGDELTLVVGHFGGELSQPLIDKVTVYRRAD